MKSTKYEKLYRASVYDFVEDSDLDHVHDYDIRLDTFVLTIYGAHSAVDAANQACEILSMELIHCDDHIQILGKNRVWVKHLAEFLELPWSTSKDCPY